MSKIFTSMALLRDVFNEHAGKEGDGKTLTKQELRELLKSDFPIPDSKKGDADELFNTLDMDKDGLVDYKEFVIFVASLMMYTE